MIQKLQTGGVVTLGYSANPMAQMPLAAPNQTQSTDDGLISKDLILKLTEKGIPVDVDNLLEAIGDLEYKLNMGIPISSRTVRKLESQINRVVLLANYLEKAEERAVLNDSFGEIAVGDRGELFTLTDKGDIRKVSIGDYNIEKHGPALTVNELIEQRKFNPTQAYDTSITTAVGNNIGMSKISEYIQKIVSSVGSSETSSEAYSDLAGIVGREMAKRPTQEQLQTLQQLYKLSQTVGMDTLFKEKNLMKSKNIQEAFEFINSVLPRKMRLQMLARFVANGFSLEDSARGVSDIIGQALLSGNDVKSLYGLDYDGTINKAAGTSSGTKMEQKRNLKAIETLVQGSLNKVDYNLVSSKNPSVGMTLHGNRIGALANFDNNIVPKSPMSLALETSLGPLIDKQHVTMGTQKINESMFDTILYDGNDVINVWAPTDSNGDIDLQGLLQFNEILEYFDSDPSLTVADKNRTLAEFGIQGRINEDGAFTGSGNMAQFLVFTGITSDEVINSQDDFVDALEGDQKKFELDQIERVYGYVNSKNKNKHGDLEFRKGWFNFSTDILRAPVFMKLKSTAQTEVGTFANHGPLVMTLTYQDQVAMDLMKYNLANQELPFYQPSSSIIML